ncbi:DUF5107 domain-containing protein [Cohnella silvisoli]|uniref:DUF5107 domain-containing protein n=1 Tax=Cohnella silvisoli TaxID=2873699 RepID=A0ABV1KMK3_9BACL|nr:DUF5107 domain-containing protein [Cohnella silvisoli]MCD9020376.1 DUF5107 domain-containing protein [Cohnella silvisoli]
MLTIHKYEQFLLTHQLTPSGPIPTAQDPDGVYPYESYCETSDRPVMKSYRFISMENEAVRVVICPDLGGKVYSIVHKQSNKETLYVAPIVRPIRILPRQFYIGGGIEVSFPISHSPVQSVPVAYETKEHGDRLYVWCGEREVRFGMQWTVEYSLGREDAFLTQRTYFFNPTGQAHPWMSWSNAGVPACGDTEFHFPGGPVLYHGDEMKMLDWRKEGPKRQSDMKRMAGFFWRDPDCHAFGAYTPSLGCGLYHIADPELTPGMKLWTDGVEHHQEFVTQWTLNGAQCLEIQAGPIVDQSIKNELQPQQDHHHIEFWIPSDEPLDIYRIKLPQPELLPLAQIPRFDYAREEEIRLWRSLISNYRQRQTTELPAPPDLDDNRWAPSGMEELEEALQWVCAVTQGDTQGKWLFQLGSWYAGNDRIDDALPYLNESSDDRARVLAARIYRRNKRDSRASAECFRKIKSLVFALHPQVVFERDLTLALLGNETIEEREYWLRETVALKDEWLIERRAALLIDRGHFEEAKQLLEQTRFQLIHQRYARSKLWNKITEGLHLAQAEIPLSLGEDDLFEFGAYREYQEEDG